MLGPKEKCSKLDLSSKLKTDDKKKFQKILRARIQTNITSTCIALNSLFI